MDRDRTLTSLPQLKQKERISLLGFSLIELVIVVAIVGILSSIAYPSYLLQAQKTRRVDALNLLTSCAAQQERAFSVNNSYVLDVDEAPLCGVQDGSFRSSDRRYYRVVVVAPKEDGCSVNYPNNDGNSPRLKHNCFTVVVSVVKSRVQFADTQCAKFEITHLGVRLAMNVEDEVTTSVCFRD